MPITDQTVDDLRSMARVMSCPGCGRHDRPIKLLSACGHYLCSQCVQQFVAKSDNKCPKCFAINYTTDAKDDLVMNAVIKSAVKIIKLIDERQSPKDTSKPLAAKRQAVDQVDTGAKTGDYNKDLIINSLKACVANGAKQKSQKSGSSGSEGKALNNKQPNKQMAKKRADSPPPMTTTIAKVSDHKKSIELVIESDMESMDSIPDSFDDQVMADISRTKDDDDEDNTELVSVILEGLEANNDPLSIELDSTFGSEANRSIRSSAPKLSQKKSPKKPVLPPKVLESKSCQTVVDSVDKQMQTQEMVKKVVKSMAIQSTVELNHQSVQTLDPVIDNSDKTVKESANCCESNNCCFHKFIDTIPCQSLQTFLKQLVEFKATPAVNNEPTTSVPNESPTDVMDVCEPSVNAVKQQMPETHDSDEVIVKDMDNKKDMKLIDEKKIVQKVSTKRVSNESNKRSKKQKTVDEDLMAKALDLKPNNQLIDKINDKFKDNSDIVEENAIVLQNIESTEPKGKKQKPLKPQSSRSKSSLKTTDTTLEDKSVADEEVVIGVKAKAVPKSVPKVLPKSSLKTGETSKTKSSRKKAKTGEESVAQDLEPNDDVFVFEDKSVDKVVTDPKKNSRRKPVGKKSTKTKAIVEETEVMTEKETPLELNVRSTRKRPQLVSTDNEDNNYKEFESKLQTKSKTKRSTTVWSAAKAPPVFKRPASPARSESAASDISSTSSTRTRTSSSERSSHQKYYILNSGLDDKQKKKIQSVCRDLNAEMVDEWSDRVTHLVIGLYGDGSKNKPLLCPRNAKYLKALLGNKWIVHYDWIVDSYRSNRFVDEIKYEITADRTATEANIPHKSRTSGQKLFENKMFYFDGIKGAILDELNEIVVIGGGVIVQSVAEYEKYKRKESGIKLIYLSAEVGLPDTQTDGVKYMSKNSLMESISNFIDI